MTKNIKKSIRFSQEEFEEIEKILKNNQVDFTNYSRNLILTKKIKFPLEKEILFELNTISLHLEQIAKNVLNSSINSTNKKTFLLLLIQIEKKLVEIAP